MADPSIHYLRVFKMEILKMHIADSLSAGRQDYGGVPSRATWGAEVLNTVDWAAKGDQFFCEGSPGWTTAPGGKTSGCSGKQQWLFYVRGLFSAWTVGYCQFGDDHHVPLVILLCPVNFP